MANLTVRVVSPDETVFEGQASSMVAPAWDGKVGILPGHAPMIALLGHGQLSIDTPGGGSWERYVAGGVLKVEDNRVTILTEYSGVSAPDVLPAQAMIDPDDMATALASKGDPLV